MIDSQGSEESDSAEEIVNIGQQSTSNNLISQSCLMSNLIDSVSISNFFPNLTFRLPIICTLPERLGYFSSRINGRSDTYYPDKSSLPHLRPDYFDYKNIHLLEGLTQQPPLSYRIPVETGHILQWIHNSTDANICSKFNFICTTSRVLRSILNVPYNDGVYWTTIAIKIGSTIYLSFRDPNPKSRSHDIINSAKVKSTIVGLRLSELITIKPKGPKRRFNLNGNQDNFYTVNRLDIGQHKILYPCQVDCVIDRREYNKLYENMQFALIKSRPCEWSILQKENHQVIKAIAWWIGSFLSGSDTIICGERSKPFVIRDITTIKSDSLLHVQGNNRWTPKKCLDHLDSILTFIESNVKEDKVVYSFHWNRDEQRIRFDTCPEPISKYIPYWYMKGKSSSRL